MNLLRRAGVISLRIIPILGFALLSLSSPEEASAQSLDVGNCVASTLSFYDTETVCASGTTSGNSNSDPALVCVLPSIGGLAADDVTGGCNAFPPASTFVNQPLWSPPTVPGSYLVVLFASDESSLFQAITITVNVAPTATAQSVSTPEGVALPITLTGTGPGSDPLTFAVVTGPSNGTLSGVVPDLTYTPDLNFNGADSFTFTASDAESTSAAATISITVNTGNDNCPLIPDSDQTDTDNDGYGDVCDAFPTDPNESADADTDGIGDNADTDDDNDGMPDEFELANGFDPLDAADADLDFDGDLLSNLGEFLAGTDPDNLDSDADGLLDGLDTYPLVALIPSEQLLRRSTDNRWFVYVMSFNDNTNIAIEQKGFADITRSASYQTVSRGDFDGDGFADLLVRDTVGDQNGRWVMYTLDGPLVLTSGFVDLTRNSDWQLVASDDFDGDGKADALLRNTSDGGWLLYLLDSQTVKSEGIVLVSTDLSDKVMGTGDFNNDGRGDVLLRRADGSWLMYQMDGLSVPAASTPAMTVNTAFAVKSLADFDGDGDSDVLLRRVDGRWFMYELNGSTIDNSGSPAMTESTEFSLVSDSDFNGDGTADALLRRTDGRWFLYTLDGASIVTEGNVGMTENPLFQTVSTDDFNGDGKADALLRRADGRWVLYSLDGDVPAIIGQGAPDMTRNEAWVPQME